jgi:hypothetical protein
MRRTLRPNALFSLVGDRLFIGDNSGFSGRWRYADVIGRVIAHVDELSGPVVYRSMLPPALVQANTFVNDTASLDDRIFVAFTANDYKSVAEYWADYRNDLHGNLAMFAICDIALQCRIQRTEQPADISGNFVQVGEALYFFGGGWPTISVWRWSDDQFELVQEIATTLQCPYAFNFSPTINGVIEGRSWMCVIVARIATTNTSPSGWSRDSVLCGDLQLASPGRG